MRVLIIFITSVLYIIFYSMIVSKTEKQVDRKYNACKKYNKHSYKKHNINRKKCKGEL